MARVRDTMRVGGAPAGIVALFKCVVCGGGSYAQAGDRASMHCACGGELTRVGPIADRRSGRERRLERLQRHWDPEPRAGVDRRR